MILAWGAGSDGKPTISPPETDRTLGEAGGANLLLMIIRLGQLSDSRQAVWQSRPKPQSHRQMASQNPILCDQVLVAEQQILIHQPCYERQEASSGIDRASWNVHHNDSRSEIIIRSSILAERIQRPCGVHSLSIQTCEMRGRTTNVVSSRAMACISPQIASSSSALAAPA